MAIQYLALCLLLLLWPSPVELDNSPSPSSSPGGTPGDNGPRPPPPSSPVEPPTSPAPPVSSTHTTTPTPPPNEVIPPPLSSNDQPQAQGDSEGDQECSADNLEVCGAQV